MQKLINIKHIKILNFYKIKLGVTFLIFISIFIIVMHRYKVYSYLDNYIKSLGFDLTKISITGISKINEAWINYL